MTMKFFKRLMEKRKAGFWSNRIEMPEPGKKVAIPLGFEKPPTLQEMMIKVIRDENIRNYLRSQNQETWEEANDFSMPGEEGPDIQAPWEEEFEGQFEEEDALEREHYEPEPTGKGRRRKVKTGFVEEKPKKKEKSKEEDDGE